MSDIRETVAESTRRLAQHEYVNAAGEVVPIEQATGNRYRSKSGFERTWNIAGIEPGTPAAMFAAFGARTLMINTTSGARQRSEDEQESLDDRLARIEAGDWRERGEGGLVRGPKYDKAVLAQALVDVLGDKAQGDVDHYRARLGTDGDSDDAAKAARSYYAKVRANGEVMARYYELAKADSNADSLA